MRVSCNPAGRLTDSNRRCSPSDVSQLTSFIINYNTDIIYLKYQFKAPKCQSLMESNILHHSACHVSATDTCKTGISHCDKKLARLLLNIGVNATDGDCEQQVATVRPSHSVYNSWKHRRYDDGRGRLTTGVV